MSRITDAMRHAGLHRDEVRAPHVGDMPFLSGEDDTSGPEESPPVITPPPSANPVSAATVADPHALQPPTTLTLQKAVSDTGEEIQLHAIIRVLHRRRWIIVGVVAAAVAAAATYNHFAARVYEARARVLIEPDAPQVVPFRGVGEDASRDDYFVTQVEVLRSRALAQKTLERLNLLPTDSGNISGPIGQFLGGVIITPTKSDLGESRVVNVAYRSTDPAQAAKFANALAQTYVEQNIELRKRGSREAAEWLNQRLGELREQVKSAEGALQQYREQTRAVALGDAQNIETQKLAQLNAAVTEARAQRVEMEALYHQLVAMEQRGLPLDTYPSIAANGFIQTLKTDLAGLQRERSQLAERFGELHPDIIRINTAIQTAEDRLNSEMAKVVAGIKNGYRAAQAKEQGLASVLEVQKREVLEQSKKAIEYTALSRVAVSTQQMFDVVLQRLKETELSGELQSNNIKVLDLAEVPSAAVWPRIQVNYSIALFGGLVIGIGLVLGIEYLNPRIAEPEHIAQTLGLPLVGVVPKVAQLGDNLADLGNLPAAFQEAVRSIRTRILLSPGASSMRAVAITSTQSGEGKTVVTCSVAVAMANAGRRVLLVDADMHRPVVDQKFNIRRSPGLSDILAGDIKPSDAVVQSTVKGLFILPAGSGMENAGDLLDHQHLNELIRAFKQVFDMVVIDCPPVMVVADAAILANAAASVLFVVGAGNTSPEVARQAVERLLSVQARIMGVVLNDRNRDNRAAYASRKAELPLRERRA